MTSKRKWIPAFCALLPLSLVSGCSASHTGTPSSVHNSVGKGTKSVSIAYAGSLQLVNDTMIAPVFQKATGIAYQGRGGGAYGVAHLIASDEISPGVFESIGTGPFSQMGKHTPTWAIGFASSPLVVAYSPNSPYAPTLKAIADHKRPLKDLFTLMQNPHFHLGRTNPDTDPQGQAFILMVHLAVKALGLTKGAAHRILGANDNAKQIFAEESILSRLQSGQLDASSAYLSEAVQRHLPYIPLPSTIDFGDPADKNLYAKATMSLSNGQSVHGSPIEVYVTTVPGNASASAVRFVSFLLSNQGRRIYKENGFLINGPIIWGKKSGIPPSIVSQLNGWKP